MVEMKTNGKGVKLSKSNVKTYTVTKNLWSGNRTVTYSIDGSGAHNENGTKLVCHRCGSDLLISFSDTEVGCADCFWHGLPCYTVTDHDYRRAQR